MRKELKALEPYRIRSNRMDAQRMDLNENPYGCSKKVIKELRRMKGYELYPEYDSLLETLAEEFSLKKENLLLTCGGDDAIRIIVDGCVDRGSKVVLPSPTYSMLPVFLKAKGAVISEIPCKKDLSFPSDEVFDSIDRNTVLTAFVNPGNPTGGIIEEKGLQRIVEKGTYVLLDETYWHFAGKSYAGWVKEYDNLFIVQSFSKVYGLAGLRVGFVASDEKNIEELRKIALPYSVSSLSARAAEIALEDKDFTRMVVERTQAEKKYLKRALKPFCEVKDTHTNFLLAYFGENSKDVFRALEQRGILVRDMSSVLPGYLRISVGKRKDNRALISALKEIEMS